MRKAVLTLEVAVIVSLISTVTFAEEPPVVKTGQFPVAINYSVADGKLSVHIDGIGLDVVEHFIFNGEVIDDYLHDAVNDGLAAIEEQDNSFVLSISLPEQEVTGGAFGVVMANDTTVSSEIPSELLTQSARQLRGITIPTVRVIGKVKYRQSGCWFLRCWKSANGASINVTVSRSHFQGGNVTRTTTTNSSGKYNVAVNACGKTTVTANYNEKSAKGSYSPWCWLKGEHKKTINLKVK